MVELVGVIDVSQDLSLIPPARFGLFMGEARRMLGMSHADLAAALSDILSVVELRLLETGRFHPTESQVRRIALCLGMTLEQSVQARVRLVVDSEQGQMVTGGTVATFVPHAATDDVLLSYLSCVTMCRRVRPGSYISPRTDDLEVLAVALDQSPMWVRQRLIVLARQERDRIRIRVRTVERQSAIPGLGLFVAFTTVGALLLVDADAIATMPLPSLATKQPPTDPLIDTPECNVVQLADRLRSPDDPSKP